jgi:hypothetical protein
MRNPDHAAAGGGFTRPQPLSLKRGALCLVVFGSALLLSACGGGGDSVSLGINATVGGRPLTTVVAPGSVGTIDMAAGQSIELDANEPVDWAFSVAGSPMFGTGGTLFYNGLAITETAVSPSRVVLDIAVTGPYSSPVVISMTATSTIDAAEVAAADLVVH